MKETMRWKLIAAAGLILLSGIFYAAHYMIFHDEHHLWIFFIGDLAFIPIEVLVVTLIIDQMLESRDKQKRMEKLNMVIGSFFSKVGTPLLAQLCGVDPSIDSIKNRLVISADWQNNMFRDVQECLNSYACDVAINRIDMEALREFLVNHDDFLLRLVENPMIFEHESFSDLLLAITHLTEEMKARGDLTALPCSDTDHICNDIKRVYAQLIREWLAYMEYLRNHYPYLFNLAMRKNPFDVSACVIVKD